MKKEIKVITNNGTVSIYNIDLSEDINKNYLELLTKSILKLYKGLDTTKEISILEYTEAEIKDFKDLDFRLDFDKLTAYKVAPMNIYKDYKKFIDNINILA
ncbi:hypothetical protein [Clostridium perfringens]|uniref:hypothetical protein n=1 Tax=Clostridium perfringens TaxID=1502 RepID=UPI0024BC2148|nr:hypothetical protein [Clostridium perfringens]